MRQRLPDMQLFWPVLACIMALWALGTGVVAQELTPWSGGPTPALSLTDYRGVEHTLAAYRGRVVLLNFWATWCEPCREEMPALQQLQNQFGTERLVVLAVNYGEAPEKVQGFVQSTPVDFPMLLDRHTDAAKAWKVRVLPTSFVLRPDGTIRYSAVGALDWASPQIVELLTTLVAPP
jgi:thiol-disulfide isomerase/thioredoxin